MKVLAILAPSVCFASNHLRRASKTQSAIYLSGHTGLTTYEKGQAEQKKAS